jgi:hypothetical protein
MMEMFLKNMTPLLFFITENVLYTPKGIRVSCSVNHAERQKGSRAAH